MECNVAKMVICKGEIMTKNLARLAFILFIILICLIGYTLWKNHAFSAVCTLIQVM